MEFRDLSCGSGADAVLIHNVPGNVFQDSVLVIVAVDHSVVQKLLGKISFDKSSLLRRVALGEVALTDHSQLVPVRTIYIFAVSFANKIVVFCREVDFKTPCLVVPACPDQGVYHPDHADLLKVFI